MLKIFKHLLVVFLLTCPAISSAQTQKESIALLVARGDSLSRNHKLQEAADVYQEALTMNPNYLPAQRGLGNLALKARNWGEAKTRFKAVLASAPDDPQANYSLGIAYRETGKFKALLLRKLDWDKSRRFFEKALAADSLFQDVYYQYGLLKRYREKYTAAIELGQKQVQLKPGLSDAQLGLFHFYQYFLRHKGTREVLDWLEGQKWDHARYFIGEELRRSGDLEKAKSYLLSLLSQRLSIPMQAMALSLVKIYYAQEKPDSAEYYYWRAVHGIRERLGADLIFDDLKYILNDDEYRRYNSLQSWVNYVDFFQKFWVSRNPLPAAATNVRLAEHYRRLLYAEKYYDYDGFRTWFNNPDKLHYLEYPDSYFLNQEFNDKGVIFIRYGEPDNRAITLGEDVPMNDSWQYYRTQLNPEMTFHFLKENAPGNNWRLAPYITHPRMLYDRLDFGNEYYLLLHSDPMERYQIVEEMAEQSRKAVSFVLRSDRHTWDREMKPLDFPFTLVTFRGQPNQTLVELYYGIPTKQILKSKGDSEWRDSLESGIAVHDTNWQQIFRDKRDLPLAKPAWKLGAYLDLFRFSVPPDSYHVAVYARPHPRKLLGGVRFDTRFPDYSPSVLSLSDILLAEKIVPATEPSKFVKHNLTIIPNPGYQFSLKKPVFLYFEIYNLRLDANRRTRFRIEYTLKLEKEHKGTLKKVFGFLQKKARTSISISSRREGKSPTAIEHFGLDVSRLRPGEYELTLSVVDDFSIQNATRKTHLTLLK